MRNFRLVLACVLALAGVSAPTASPKRAKNVILFLADAGGIPTLSAASLYGYGAPLKMHVQGWPYLGLSDTSASDAFVTDSANGMTAIVTGQKTHNAVISQAPDGVRGQTDGTLLKTVLEYAEERGLKTGVVTDQPITDATPAACYAHSNDRGKWGEIFPQAFEPRFGDGVDILIGAGRIEIERQLVARGTSLGALAEKHQRPIFSTLDQAADTPRPVVVAESIDVRRAAMRALDELQGSKTGYFLMVEWDAHTPDPKPGLDRLVAFDKLIAEVEKRVNLEDTLLLFTADHSFGLRVKGGGPGEPLLAGYDEWQAVAKRGEPVRLKNVLVDDTHTGEEVEVLAIGAGAEQVHGFFPNTRLFTVMMEAWGFPIDRAQGPAGK